MDAKKISFGFSKVAKKPIILPSKVPKEEKTVELIKCLEGKEIKLVAEKQEAAPLVIQMLTNQKTSTALASLLKRRAVLLGEDEPEPEESTSEPLTIAEVTANGDNSTLEERAARELIAAALANGNEVLETEKMVLPALKADELPLEGAKESNIDDYDAIPIQQFGLAMLRGMGWVDPPPKKKGAAPVEEAPFLRPKGMGLGADKALKPKDLLVRPEHNEVLEIKKQAFVRILGGKYKDQYGQIEGFDDHAGRVIVKMAIGGTKEAFNEFLCQPISRKEYTQYGKCINTAKYQEYKKQENEHGQIIVKREPSAERTKSEHRNGRKKERQTYKDEERKSHKIEQRSVKLEDRRTESRDYKAERSSYKQEDYKPYKSEQRSFKREERQNENKASREDYSKFKQENRGREVSHESRNSSRYEREHDSHRSSGTSKSSSRRRQESSADDAEDTGESSESDSDSAYERKKQKKSKSSSKSKKSKSKKSKSKSHRHRRSSSSSDDSDSSADELERRRHSKHKRKSKKSKHVRSRTRSRSREGCAR